MQMWLKAAALTSKPSGVRWPDSSGESLQPPMKVDACARQLALRARLQSPNSLKMPFRMLTTQESRMISYLRC